MLGVEVALTAVGACEEPADGSTCRRVSCADRAGTAEPQVTLGGVVPECAVPRGRFCDVRFAWQPHRVAPSIEVWTSASRQRGLL